MSLCDNMCKLMGKCLISTEQVMFCVTNLFWCWFVLMEKGERYVGLDRCACASERRTSTRLNRKNHSKSRTN